MKITQADNYIDYRKIDKLSGSAIKLFDTNRSKFYREVVLKEKRKDKDTDSIKIGNIIDFILSDCKGNIPEFEQRFDEKFALLSGNKGSGQMFLLADLLFEYTQRDSNEENVCTTTFIERFTEAFENLQKQDKFKGKKLEDTVAVFVGSDAETYFKEKLSNIGKVVIDEGMLNYCKKRVELVINDENIELFKDDAENLGKTVIEWEFMGFECKSELDNLRVSHSKKEIVITEIKTNWEIEEFQRVYLKLRYYLSAKFYELAVDFWRRYIVPELRNYSIKFEFLTVDTSPNNLRPIVYTLSQTDLNKAWEGFYINGYYYKGLRELLEEIKWCQENNQWNITKLAYENNSKLPLEINYE